MQIQYWRKVICLLSIITIGVYPLVGGACCCKKNRVGPDAEEQYLVPLHDRRTGQQVYSSTAAWPQKSSAAAPQGEVVVLTVHNDPGVRRSITNPLSPTIIGTPGVTESPGLPASTRTDNVISPVGAEPVEPLAEGKQEKDDDDNSSQRQSLLIISQQSTPGVMPLPIQPRSGAPVTSGVPYNDASSSTTHVPQRRGSLPEKRGRWDSDPTDRRDMSPQEIRKLEALNLSVDYTIFKVRMNRLRGDVMARQYLKTLYTHAAQRAMRDHTIGHITTEQDLKRMYESTTQTLLNGDPINEENKNIAGNIERHIDGMDEQYLERDLVHNEYAQQVAQGLVPTVSAGNKEKPSRTLSAIVVSMRLSDPD